MRSHRTDDHDEICMQTDQRAEYPDHRQHEPDHGRRNRYVRTCRLTVGDEVKFACVDGPEFDGHLVNFDEAMKRQQMYKTEEAEPCLKGCRG